MRFERRMEAIPLSWESLSFEQKDAVKATALWLVDALGSIERQNNKPEYLRPGLNRNRRSQLGFIDGDRGTGKSSVLLTLMALTTENNDSAWRDIDSDVKELRNQRNRIVWLETLDMEPLSKGANLFAAVLARIGHVLDNDTMEMSPMAAAMSGPNSYADIFGRLRQLQNDVAVVWDRLDGGGLSNDPQTRALWITQAEKAALELNDRIGKVLDGIASIFQDYRKVDNPLFVLPVDDFDLAPSHCLELLRLIRMVTTPRLFFLIAGNTRIAESVLRLRSEGELTKVVNFRPINTKEVQRDAAEIAANNMRKLIPPGQRVRLAKLRISEALTIYNESLKKNLEAILFETNQAPTSKAEMSLASFLLPEGARGDISISEWLAGTPRQILDRIEMFAQIAELQSKKNAESNSAKSPAVWPKQNTKLMVEKNLRDDRLLVRLFEEIQRQLKEEVLLNFEQRELLVESFNSSASLSLDLSYLHIEQRNSYQKLKDFKCGDLVSVTPVGIDASIVTGNRKGSYEIEGSLDRRVGVCLLFAHDFVASLWGGYLRHSPLTYRSNVGPQVEVRWQTNNEKYLALQWPSLEWWTFRDFDRFNNHWRLHVDQCDGRYGAAWLVALLEVALNIVCQPGLEGLKPTRLLGFIIELIQEVPKRTARRLLRKSALITTALLLAPEYQSGLELKDFEGESVGFVEAILEPEIQNKIRMERARILGKVLKSPQSVDSVSGITLIIAIAPASVLIGTRQSIINQIHKITETLSGQMNFSDEVITKINVLDKLNLSPKSYNKHFEIIRELQKYIPSDSPRMLEVNRLEVLLHKLELFNAIPTHPFNKLLNGAFVPSEDDIDRARG